MITMMLKAGEVMVTRAEIEEYAEIERAAVAAASKRGLPPRLDAGTAAIITAIGVFCLLEIFAALTVQDWAPGYWPAVIVTAICATGAYCIQRYRERTWLARVEQERMCIEAKQERCAR
jgi:hypothetical protein